MRLLAWNIRQGGGSRLPRIADALNRRGADVLVLSEYRGGESGMRLLSALHALGYRHATTLGPPPNRNGVLIAARCPFRERGAVGRGLPEPYRMVSVEFAAFRLSGIFAEPAGGGRSGARGFLPVRPPCANILVPARPSGGFIDQGAAGPAGGDDVRHQGAYRKA